MITDQARCTLATMRKSSEEAEKRKVPKQWVLDKLADEAFRAGWDISRANQCERCFQVASCNGRCGCEYPGIGR